MIYKGIIIILFVVMADLAHAQTSGLYFPPLTGSTWDTVNPLSLGWCQSELDSVISFMDQKHTKAFIILKDGKIAVEKYYGTFTADSLWYWASAGKSLTAFLTGIAQEEGLLDISDSSSDFLGNGWTSCSMADEGMITIRNQLSMTTGLNDLNSTNDCTLDTCLFCIAAPDTRWAYHNAPYSLLHPVLAAASGASVNNFTQTRILNKTGMTGQWFPLGFNEVFFSNARSMARFGLLALSRGIWDGDTLLHDTVYFNAMTNTSQNLNLSYGYLWWLNGKGSHMLPGLQLVFPGQLVPSAPADMISALGKNDQKIHVVPSMNLVVVRMGDAADSSLAAPTNFDEQLWQKLNAVFCNSSGLENFLYKDDPKVFPNPFSQILHLEKFEAFNIEQIELFNVMGQQVISTRYQHKINLSDLKPGNYILRLTEKMAMKTYNFKIIKN